MLKRVPKYEAESKKEAESKEKVPSATPERDHGEVQAVQPVTEYKRSDHLELCLQRSAFSNGQPGKDWLSH